MHEILSEMIIDRLKYLISSISALLFFSIIVPAQSSLPSLPVDSRIQKGTLGSGVTYYMVTDPTEKGYANVAIVQRDDPLSQTKRDGLDASFLSRMGIAPGPEGYLSDRDGSTVYTFMDVPFYRKEVLDSTLLYTFEKVAESRAEQAVIVSGDIDAPELKKKMDIFSMLVPRMLVRENHVPDYVWEPSPAPSVLSHPSEVAEVAVTYAGSRIPFHLMNTAQAVVTDLFGMEFQVLLRHRLERNLKDSSLPYGEIGFRSLRSADYGGDERYTVYVTTDQAHMDPVMRVISSTVGEMDSFGVTGTEYSEAKQILLPKLRERVRTSPSAASYVNRCAANFLYGANLAPYSEHLHFFARKNVADSTEAQLFNRFADALLCQLDNLTLEYSGAPDSLDRDEALFYYNLAYLYGSVAATGKNYGWSGADSLGLEVQCPKVRLKSEKKDVVSDGVLWTFTNGMRVVFKQIPGGGSFRYSLLLNGGLASIPGLNEGEGGYIADLLMLNDVGGLPAPAFHDMLSSAGISMESLVHLHSMEIRGEAPSTRLGLLVKSLLDMSQNRIPNLSEFKYFSRREALRSVSTGEKLYSAMLPGYTCSQNRVPSALSQETFTKADAFFTERFARMNDGVLIIVGDLNPDSVKKLLGRYLGGFRVLKGNAPRPGVGYRPLSGVTTLTEAGPDKGVHILINSPLPMTKENFFTAQVAVEALQKALLKELIPYGVSVELEPHFTFQPQERFGVEIHCRPLPVSGIPSSVPEMSPQGVLSAVRHVLAKVQFDETDLSAWKSRLAVDTEKALSEPSGVVTSVIARYAVLKDMVSDYHAAISGISKEGVNTVLAALAGGGRIELMVE